MQEKLSFQTQVKIVVWALKMAYKANPFSFPFSLFIEFIQLTQRPANLYVSAIFVDGVINAIIKETVTVEIIVNYLALYFVVNFFYSLLNLFDARVSYNISFSRSDKFELLLTEKKYLHWELRLLKILSFQI